jgi:TonB dependent receptor-like, beta-barrel/CarboxypepD_reg-like domain/TonB-dependent Receptor Plug Domain
MWPFSMRFRKIGNTSVILATSLLVLTFLQGVAVAQESEPAFAVAATAPTATTDTIYPGAATLPALNLVNFAGRLLERGTRRPMSSATVVLKETEVYVLSQDDGTFEFIDLPGGEYTVIVAAVGYRKFETRETIDFDTRLDVVYYVDPQFISAYEIVVTEQRERTEVSRTTLNRQELARVPGSGGDPLRAIEALPGISKARDGGDDMLVRGSSPESNYYFYNRVPAPGLYHFGGLRSIFNGEMIDRIDFIAGGHGVRYGSAMDGSGPGGVVDIYNRDPRSDRLGGFVDLNFIIAEVMLEGPIGEDTSFVISGKRSYLDLIMQPMLHQLDMDIDVFPNFWDYQIEVVHRPDEDTRYSVFAIGWRDTASLVMEEDNPDEPELRGNFLIDQSFHGIGANIDNAITGSLRNYLSPYFGYSKAIFDIGDSNYVHEINRSYGFSDRLEYKYSREHTFNLGVEAMLVNVSLDAEIIRPPSEGDVYVSFSNSESMTFHSNESIWGLVGYVEEIYSPNEQWKLTPGLRMTYSDLADETVFDPRVSTMYQITDETLLKAAWGLYQEFPEAIELIEPFGTPGLNPEITTQYLFGVEHQFSEAVNLDVQMYYKDMQSLVMQTESGDPYYSNRGRGFSYGGEIFLRHALIDRFFGWISYSYNISRRNYGGGSYKVFEFDQPHTLNLVASYQLTREFEIGAKWSYTSGDPDTPVVGSIYNADNNTYIPIHGEQNSVRTPDYHRLDLRFDYKFIYDTWMLDLYLEVINAYARENPAGYQYNYDYSEKDYYSQMSFMPFLGVKASF